jgi:hypothetical protein
LATINQLQGNVFPMTDIECETHKEVNRLAKMRSLLDRAVLMRRQRKVLLKELVTRIKTSDMETADAQSNISRGEAAIEATSQRLHALSEALQEATELTLGYQRILDVVSRTPPYQESHYQEIEANLVLARQQLQDMVMYRKNVYVDAQRLHSVKLAQLQQKMQYYSQARRKIARKRRDYLAQHGIQAGNGDGDDDSADNDSLVDDDNSSVGSMPSVSKQGKKNKKSARKNKSFAGSSSKSISTREHHAAKSRSRKLAAAMAAASAASAFAETIGKNITVDDSTATTLAPDSHPSTAATRRGRSPSPDSRGTKKSKSPSSPARQAAANGDNKPHSRSNKSRSNKARNHMEGNETGQHDTLPAIMNSLIGAFKKAKDDVRLSVALQHPHHRKNKDAAKAGAGKTVVGHANDRVSPSESGFSTDDESDNEDSNTEATGSKKDDKHTTQEANKHTTTKPAGGAKLGGAGRNRLLAAMAAVDADTREKNKEQQHKRRKKRGVSHDKDQLLNIALDAFNKKVFRRSCSFRFSTKIILIAGSGFSRNK